MLVGVRTTTPPPVSTLCALSEPPRHLGFLYHWVGWLSSKQWGSSTTRGEAFSNKGQRCWLESVSAAKTPQPCVNLTFLSPLHPHLSLSHPDVVLVFIIEKAGDGGNTNQHKCFLHLGIIHKH